MSFQITRTKTALIAGLVVSLGYSVNAGTEPTKLPQGELPQLLSSSAEEVPYVADPEAPIEIVQERHPNGKVKNRREVTRDSVGNYILHGQWKMWDEDGNEIAAGQYRNNRRHGKWFRIHPPENVELFSRMPYKEFQGPFTSTASFDDGRLHGTWTMVDSLNRQASQWEYAHGLRHGVSLWQYASGKKMREITYRDGLIDGKHQAWDKTSRLVADETYQSGSKLAPKIEYYDSGRKKSEAMHLHAPFVIDSPDNWWNARPVQYRAIGDDQRHGRWTSWYPTGQKKSEGMFDHGIRDGQFVWWFANSQQAATGNYKQGQPHGVWAWWHDNGQKSATGQYVESDMTGHWYHWRNDGQLRQKADYSGGAESIARGDNHGTDNASTPQISRRTTGQTLAR